CHKPGISTCYRTRQCRCTVPGYHGPGYCSGSSKEYKRKPCCITICYPPQPYAPENGRRAEGSDTEPYYVGEVIRFVCNIGYPIVGKDSIKCLSNGQWDGPVPTCNPVCYWKQWGSWINGDCVASGLPLTPQCYRPGTSLCYRTRRCYCVGRGYSRSTYCTGSSKEYETKTCCLPYLPPPPSCRWEPWGPWKNHGRCEKNGLPGTPNCAYPGTLRCYRTRECNCRRKRHGGTAYCHGPSKEYENKPCCYKHTYTPPHYPPPGYPPILHPMK
ncbi:unnamed protein product, partial [Owenia fusiformis]